MTPITIVQYLLPAQ